MILAITCGTVFILIAILVIIQLFIIIRQIIICNNTQKDKITYAITHGIIKKHILKDNTKEEYNSYNTLLNYQKFIETNLYKTIMELKDKPYNG